ncbi:hypothetical protein M514_26309 [Trichuris suis]|uniref:HTH CENPB-type domain-containing protein n=1 Tax=Trichuris suis TaxID=68888 RepID=A0A085MWA0_9BILA|nr:hypothetical protein M514_26309 [Trichuris suis]
MTGPLLCEKALEFNWRLGADPDFKASQSWLEKLKRRHGIHGRENCGEKLSSDQLSADAFRVVLHTFMEEGGYDEEFVYNADEAGLNWKSLPTRSLVAHHEAHTSGHKARKERVTVMICANSMGSHRLPLFVIGKPAKPRSFRNVKKLPVVYSHQKKAWMNVHAFNEWFERTFIPEMDQGVIGTLKLLYRKRLLRQLLSSEDDTPESVASFYKRITLKVYGSMAAESWTLLKQATLRGSWNKLLVRRDPDTDTGDWNADSGVNREMEEIMDTLRSTSICEKCERADVER